MYHLVFQETDTEFGDMVFSLFCHFDKNCDDLVLIVFKEEKQKVYTYKMNIGMNCLLLVMRNEISNYTE